MQFTCPGCSQLIMVPDDTAGKTAVCPKCSNKTIIPTPAPAIPTAEIAPPEQEKKLRNKKRDRREHDDSDEPKTRCYFCGKVIQCRNAVRVKEITGRWTSPPLYPGQVGMPGNTWTMVDSCQKCVDAKAAANWLLLKVALIIFSILLVMAIILCPVAWLVLLTMQGFGK